jgi:hypothetical protein
VRILSALALLLFSFPALAWSDSVQRRIAQKSAQLAPPDLRTLISRFEDDYESGRRAAAESEAHQRGHLYSADRNSVLKQQIEREVNRAISTMRSRKSTREFVATLGHIAHLVSDANHPLLLVDTDRKLAAMKPDLDRYLESRAGVIPTIFYGLKQPFSLPGHLDTTFRRSASYRPLLAEQYFPSAGPPRTSANFDDRSTAFAIVSLSYSHSVTDLVNVYYYIWKEVGGDVRSAAAMRKGTILLNTQPPLAEPLKGGFGAPAEPK